MRHAFLGTLGVLGLLVGCSTEAGEPNPGTGGSGTGGMLGGTSGTGAAGQATGGGAGVGVGGGQTGGTGGAGGTGGVGATGGVGGAGATSGMGGSPAGTGGGGAAAGGTTGGGAGSSGSAGAGTSGGGAGGNGGTAGGGAGDAGNAGSGAVAGGGGGNMEWLPSWATTIQGYESGKADHQPAKPLPNNTLRQFVYPTFTGGQVRLQLSNEKGAQPLQVQKANIALAGSGAGSIDAASAVPLTFGGQPGTSIPAGQTAWSDGVAFPLEAMKLTAISIQFGSMVPTELTTHPGSRTTSYFADGDTVASATLPSPGTRDRWYFINAIEVMAPPDAYALGCLGDSITDGYGILNQFQRWTDYLTVRIQADQNLKNKVSVLNFGMGANNLTSGNADMDAGKDRFDRDVLARPKVKWVIVLEGVNDINGGVQANTIISAYQEIVNEGHQKGIKIFGSPITPMGSNNAVRNTVNMSVRTGGYFDAIVDFDAVLRDPNNQSATISMYRNDDLHPNAAGYQAMAAAVNLGLLVP